MLYTALIVIHIVLAIGLIAVVLVQRGPGATMGAAFGAGASGTVFGAKGSASFLGKLTGWVGVAFFLISLSMAVLLARSGGSQQTAQDLGVAERLIEAPVDISNTDAFLAPPVEGEQSPEAVVEDGAEADAEDTVTELPDEPPPDA